MALSLSRQIHNAAQHPVNLDLAQASAVEARILLDLRIGAAFTRLQTLTLQSQIGQLADTGVISYGAFSSSPIYSQLIYAGCQAHVNFLPWVSWSEDITRLPSSFQNHFGIYTWP